MGHKLGLLLLGLVLVLSCGSEARADQIVSGTLSLPNCGSVGSKCPAADYSFSVGTTSATLSVAITGGVVAGVNDYITGVDLGFLPSNLSVNVTNFSSVPAGSWSTVDTASLSNNGCGSNSGAFVCASGSGLPIASGQTYTFTWTYDAIDMSKVDAASDVHIGTNYGPHNGLIVSTNIGSAPEPSSLLLLLGSLGAFGLVGLRRRTV